MVLRSSISRPEEFSNSFTIVVKYISAPNATTETAVTEEDDTTNVNNVTDEEEVDQDEEETTETVTYLTESKNNFINNYLLLQNIRMPRELHISYEQTFQIRKL